MADTSARWGIVEPSADRSDPADVPLYVRNVVASLEAQGAMYNQGTAANRPVSTPANPGKIGRLYYATDTAVLSYDYGTGWSQITAPPASIPYIPGEIKMWSGSVLPAAGSYGVWVWADGAIYATATYPQAAANIANAWRTHGGKADPGAGNFRVPDMRGQTPVGMDGMPGGTMGRANKVSRSGAIVLAAVTGEEYHILSQSEMPNHNHTLTDPGHSHNMEAQSGTAGGAQAFAKLENWIPAWYTFISASGTGITIASAGGGAQHENLQPTTFVPYIVKLDG